MTRVKGARRALAAIGLLATSGCTDLAGYDLDYLWGYIPALATMRGSLIYDPYEMPRLAAEHTIPVVSPMGDIPERFAQTALDSAAATFTSPYGGSPGEAVLTRGREQYANQCAACHGPQGAGNGPVVGAGKYPFAPAINGAATVARSDGYLYAVIVGGRGLMPPYGERLTESDRWAVVHYVRQLQGGAQGVGTAQGTAPAAPAPTPAPGAPPADAQPSPEPAVDPIAPAPADTASGTR